MLLLVLPAHGETARQPSQSPDIALLSPPRVTSGSDAAMSKVDPQVLQDAKKAPPGGTLGIIVVSQGQLRDTDGLQRVIAGHPDPNGLIFTGAQVSPAQLARFAGMTNVIAILSNTPPEIPPLPEPQY